MLALGVALLPTTRMLVDAEMITVSVDESRRRTPPLYGWSTEITVTDVADMQLAATTALTHASIARYPGGTPADYMDWRTGWHCVFSSLPIPEQTRYLTSASMQGPT